MEPKFLAAAVFIRSGGLLDARAFDQAAAAGFNGDLEPDSVIASGSQSLVLTGPGDVGSSMTSDMVQSNISTVSGADGGSTIGISGVVSGMINANVQTDLDSDSLGLGPVNSSAGVQSEDAVGNPAPITWNILDSDQDPADPTATSTGYVQVTFHVDGTDGISSGNLAIVGAFTLHITSPQINVEMNAGSTVGLAIYDSTTGETLYHDNNADGSPDGLIRWNLNNVGTTDTQGGASFSATYQGIFPIVTGGGTSVEPIQYSAGFGETVQPMSSGTHAIAIPQMEWSFNVSAVKSPFAPPIHTPIHV